MTEQDPVNANNGDEKADALAATAVIALVIGAVVYWLQGMPV